MPNPSWRGRSLARLREVGRSLARHRAVDLAAQLAFYAVLGLFPFTIFLATVVGFLPIPGLLGVITTFIEEFAPPDVTPMLAAATNNVFRGASRTLLVLGLGGALVTASGAVRVLAVALDRAYGVTERRPWWKVRLRALAITAVAAVLVIAATSALLVGQRIGAYAASAMHVDSLLPSLWRYLRWPTTTLTAVALLAFLYYFCPNVPRAHRRVLPGALVGVALWILLTVAFDYYVAHLGRMKSSYGALGAGIVLLLWMQLSSLVVIAGGELNAALPKRARPPLRARREPVPIGR